jgi:hypothetical protein
MTYCEDVPLWKIEKWWELNVPGTSLHQPKPIHSYQKTLSTIQSLPNSTTPADETLIDTSLVSEDDYIPACNGAYAFEAEERKHSKYG